MSSTSKATMAGGPRIHAASAAYSPLPCHAARILSLSVIHGSHVLTVQYQPLLASVRLEVSGFYNRLSHTACLVSRGAAIHRSDRCVNGRVLCHLEAIYTCPAPPFDSWFDAVSSRVIAFFCPARPRLHA